MSNKFKKSIILLTVLSLAFSVFCVPSFCVDEEETSEAPAVIEPIIIDPIEEEVPTEKPTEKSVPKKETPTTTEKAVEAPKQEKTGQQTQKPADDTGNDEAGVVADNGNKQKVKADNNNKKTYFTVYIELNNGQDRLRYDMDAPGLLKKPSNPPVRKGFVFDGYYKDERFTEKWDFDKTVATDGTVIYVKWKTDKSGELYDVEVADLIGGKITANPEKAMAGEQVNITVVPEEGNRMKEGSLTINGVQTDFFSFKMGEGPAVIHAEFERIPVPVKPDHRQTVKKVIIGVAAVVAVTAVVIFVIWFIRKRRMFTYDAPGWVDDSIVLEKGFVDGRVIKENAEKESTLPDENSFITLDDEDLK